MSSFRSNYPLPGQRSGPDPYPRNRIKDLEEEVRRLEDKAGDLVGFGTVGIGCPVFAYTAIGLPASYPTGGFTYPALNIVPGLTDVWVMPYDDGSGTTYTFRFDGTDKVQVFTNGTEVGNGVDLTLVTATVNSLAIGVNSKQRTVYTAQESVLFHGVDVWVSEELTFDPNDYWTLKVSHETAAGETFALETLSTATRTLFASKAVRVADNETGRELGPGDRITLTIAENSTPDALVNLSIRTDIRRRVE